MDSRFTEVEKRARRVFFLAIVVVLAIMMALNYLNESKPSDLQVCVQTCATYHRQGELVHKFTAEQTAGMHSRGPAECQCR
jgi:hypothetical protein